MIIGEKVQYWKNGEMKTFMYYEHTYKIKDLEKPLRRWYRMHPYAKRINKHWICNDYRIDQQRPQRNVYSERYLKIVQMTEMEEKIFDKLIKDIEKDINYPTVWDDGKTRHYEDTIHCPNCGKRRKVLTSKTHCEFCGFVFSNAKKCPKCKDLNLMYVDICKHCGYDFNSKSEDEIKIDYEEEIRCPICDSIHIYDGVCGICEFDFRNKKQCAKCKKWIDIEDKYCGYCGQKQIMFVECSKCGEKNHSKNKFCNHCGEKL